MADERRSTARPRILVVQTAFLGDVVLATPLLKALRARFPEAFLAFMGTPAGTELVRGLSGVDEFMVYDKRGAERGMAGLRKKARELKAMNFEFAVSAHRSARTAALLYLAGIERRIGFATSAVPWLYHDRVPRHPRDHEVLRNLGLLGPLGGAPEGLDLALGLPRPAAAGPDLLGGNGARPRVGICPGSVWATKRWMAEGFARVADVLSDEAHAGIYLIGAAQDEEAARAVAGMARSRVHNMAGRTSLGQWLRLVAAMDLVITNDSSPTHIACALQVPVVTVFGPTATDQGFSPWGNSSRVVETAGLNCRPCGEHGARRCPEGHFKCMSMVRPDDVLAAARELLAEKK
ncbi:MAG TPA: glycosyltransferase family 9 protein [bacterium]|nr:glycosyltransferase family 9 protein [bacterium]